MRKPDPKDFGEMPSARHRKERPHLVDVIAAETGVPGVPGLSRTPDTSGVKATRTTRVGETVKRATFWFTEADLESIGQLQRILTVPGIAGAPDKSAVVREAIRRLAADLITTDGTHDTPEIPGRGSHG